MSNHILTGALALAVAVSLHATPMFNPGDIFWATGSPANLYNVSGGGDQSSAPVFATLGSYQAGQIAFTSDLTTAYVSVFAQNRVLRIDAAGTVSTFATGISAPTGVLVSNSGKVFVSSYSKGKVFDITAGGSFTNVPAYASGLINPRNLLETSGGILVVDQGAGKVINLGTGGNLAGAPAFASGLNNPIDIVQYKGRVYTAGGDNRIMDITLGGDVSGLTSFAAGRPFISLAVSGNKLLAGSDYTLPSASIWDISAGGDFTSAPALISNLNGGGESLLDSVPQDLEVDDPSAATPEPSTGLLLAAGLILVIGVGRASASSSSL